MYGNSFFELCGTVRKRLEMTTENSATHLALCSPVQGARMENLHK